MTIQFADRLVIEGDATFLVEPMAIPRKHPGLVDLTIRGVRPSKNSACRRGHVATWAIRNGRLFMVEISGRYSLKGAPIPADWNNRYLVLPVGRCAASWGIPGRDCSEMLLQLKLQQGVVARWRLFRDGTTCRGAWAPGFPWEKIKGEVLSGKIASNPAQHHGEKLASGPPPASNAPG